MLHYFDISKWKLSILSGILIGLAYPPSPLGFLAWFGLIPLIHIILKSYVTGLIVNIITVYWFGLNSGAGFTTAIISMIAAILYLSIFWLILGLVCSWYHQKTGYGLFVFPLLWVSIEYLRSFGPLSFPWINLGLTQTFSLPLIQIADVTGTMGISFWIVMLNIIIYLAINSKRIEKKILSIGVLLLLVIFLLGFFRISIIQNQDILHSMSQADA